MQKQLCTAGAFFFGLSLLQASTAQAGLISSVSYHQTSNVEDATPIYNGDGVIVAKTLIGTTLPVSTTLTEVSPDCSEATTYNFTDNGTTAVFSALSQGTMHQFQDSINESSIQPYDLSFVLSQPATYFVSISFAQSAGVGAGAAISGGVGTNPTDASLFYFDETGDPITYSGTLSAGVRYQFQEGWSATAGPGVGTYTASDNFSLTLTAIPEPAAMSLMLAAFVGIGRRRAKR